MFIMIWVPFVLEGRMIFSFLSFNEIFDELCRQNSEHLCDSSFYRLFRSVQMTIPDDVEMAVDEPIDDVHTDHLLQHSNRQQQQQQPPLPQLQQPVNHLSRPQVVTMPYQQHQLLTNETMLQTLPQIQAMSPSPSQQKYTDDEHEIELKDVVKEGHDKADPGTPRILFIIKKKKNNSLTQPS